MNCSLLWCGTMQSYRCYVRIEGLYRFQMKLEVLRFSKTLIATHRLHGVTPQKTRIDTFSTVEASNLTFQQQLVRFDIEWIFQPCVVIFLVFCCCSFIDYLKPVIIIYTTCFNSKKRSILFLWLLYDSRRERGFVIYFTTPFRQLSIYSVEWQVICEWWIGKDFEGSGRGLILRYHLRIFLEELKKSTKNLSQGSQSPDLEC
jgi:hypothetical protein